MQKSVSELVKTWLELLRSGTEDFELIIGYLREDAKHEGFSLADIGTSEEELHNLRVNGHKTIAQKWLGRLRAGHNEHPLRLAGYIHWHAKKGVFSLADIGASEEELSRLAPASQKKKTPAPSPA